MNARLSRWFAEDYDPERPFFIFLNYFEPHDPYTPPMSHSKWATAETKSRWPPGKQASLRNDHMLLGTDILSANDFDELVRLYDGEILYADSKVGELLEFFDRTGLTDNTLIIVTSDHGEHFGEHHMTGHAFSLYEPLVRVPLIVRWDGHIPTARSGASVQAHDVYPTVLEAAGLPWQPGPQHNCRTLLSHGQDANRITFSEYTEPMMWQVHLTTMAWRNLDFSRFRRRLHAAQAGDLKLIRPSEGESELYDLSKDPLELRDLATDRPEKVKELSGKLDDWLNSFQHYQYQPPANEQLKKLSPEELERMRGLGYV